MKRIKARTWRGAVESLSHLQCLFILDGMIGAFSSLFPFLLHLYLSSFLSFLFFFHFLQPKFMSSFSMLTVVIRGKTGIDGMA